MRARGLNPSPLALRWLLGVALLCDPLLSASCTSSPVTVDGGIDAGSDAGVVDLGTDAARVYVPEPFTPTAETRAYCAAGGVGADDGAIEARITDALAHLSVAEKVGFLHGNQIVISGGVWTVPGNAALGFPGLHMLDGPRGVSAFAALNGTAFPVAMMRGATWDPTLEQRVGAAMAVEERAAGADTILAPTINILRHPRWGRAQETYSEDVHHMGEMAVAFIDGVQSEDVIASVKHFAAYSIENTRHEVNVQVDERTLREIYLPHFRRAVVEAHAGSVMSAYNQVDGLYCDVNGHLLHDILKGEWGFAGFVESDWLLGTHGSAESIQAGLDVEMPVANYFNRLAMAVATGTLTEADLDRAVRRVIRAQLCYGLDAHPAVIDASQRETPEHLALAREVARRGAVLLRDERPDGAPPTAPPVLPLAAGALTHVVVLGRNADVENLGDHGSSNVMATTVTTALEGLTERAGAGITVTSIGGTTLDAAASATVAAADVAIIVTGLQSTDEGEAEISAGDRASLALPPDEVALIHTVAAVQPAVVVVLEAGAAITVSDWASDVEGILFAFYPGSEGGHALADLLFGDFAPSGRLPFSIPENESDLPPFDDVSTTVTYGYLHGYRYLDAMHTAARYPFGYGLTYTTFAYSGLTLASSTLAPDGTLDATVTVTNTGTVAATETVQLYVAALGSAVLRAPDDLRAFAQVTLDPGASAPVTLHVPVSDLAYYDVASSAFVVEPLTYEARLGPSSAGPFQTATFDVH